MEYLKHGLSGLDSGAKLLSPRYHKYTSLVLDEYYHQGLKCKVSNLITQTYVTPESRSEDDLRLNGVRSIISGEASPLWYWNNDTYFGNIIPHAFPLFMHYTWEIDKDPSGLFLTAVTSVPTITPEKFLEDIKSLSAEDKETLVNIGHDTGLKGVLFSRRFWEAVGVTPVSEEEVPRYNNKLKELISRTEAYSDQYYNPENSKNRLYFT